MFLLSVKKMLKNKWITACLFFGCFLLVAILSSIPVYSAGVLNKLLIRDLQSIQESTKKYPGICAIKTSFKDDIKNSEAKYKNYTQTINRSKQIVSSDVSEILGDFHEYHCIDNGPFYVFNEGADTTKKFSSISRSLFIAGTTSFLDHVNIVNGKAYTSGVKDGCYEAIVSEKAAFNAKLSVGTTYIMTLNNILAEKSKPIKVKIIGVYAPKDVTDVFWYNSELYDKSILIDYDTVCNNLIKENHSFVNSAVGYITYDYEKLNNKQITPLYSELIKQERTLPSNSKLDVPILEAVKQYEARQHKLNTIIIALIIPLLVVLLLYVYMIAKLIVGYDENEISVLKSRGATKNQILRIYLFECLIISIIALLVGIPFGVSLSHIIGYSNGFLEFVSRSRFNVTYNLGMLLYPLCGVLIFTVVTLIPVVRASMKNVLTHKQTHGLELKTPIWQKAFLDIILIAVSLYGLYLFYDKQDAIVKSATELKSNNNPLTFIMPSIFILGVSLLALRIYPWILKLIHYIGKRHWSASFHVLMINMSRNKSMGKLIILFLTFTVSVGIFNATTARTITQNSKDKIYYKNGADIILEDKWVPSGYIQVQPSPAPATPIYGQAPPFDLFRSLDGVEAAARVYTQDEQHASFNSSNGTTGSTNFMAVVPDEFSKVAWFRDDLLDYHINEYLNILAKFPTTCLISKTMSDSGKIKIGDSVGISFDKLGYQSGNGITLQVAGIIDYFPTYNKNEGVGTEKSNLIVANFNYIFNKTAIDKYKTWLKLKPNATTSQVYDSIQKNNINILSITNVKENVITDVNNDPFVQGINGTLSLTFVISLFTTCVGFLIYLIVSVKNRSLQFSVLRSMGISKRSLYRMIAFEQILISSFSVLAGTIIGGVTSNLFVQSIGIHLDLSSQVPPFKVLIELKDYIRIYVVVLVLIIICISVIISIVRKLNITATLKLGED